MEVRNPATSQGAESFPLAVIILAFASAVNRHFRHSCSKLYPLESIYNLVKISELGCAKRNLQSSQDCLKV